MKEIIDTIIEENKNLFKDNNKIEKINIGFTNTIYNINDTYIIKICTNKNNEDKFKNEISFYIQNKNNSLIPKLYKYSLDKKTIPYYYEIIEKISGVSLYNVWHKYIETEREIIIKQLCEAMKLIHKNKGNKYNWSDYHKTTYQKLYNKIKSLKIFNAEEDKLLNEAYLNYDKYLESEEFVLVHNDLHFDNIFINDNKIKIIDFERSMYAPRDFELDILYRMIRKPWKFASEETEKYTNINDYKNIMFYIEKYYPELIKTPNLFKRLSIYDLNYYLKQLLEYPHLEELKNDVLNAAKNIIAKE